MQSRCCPLTLMDLNPSPFLVSESSLPLPVLSSDLIAAVDGEKKLRLGSLKCFDEIFTYQLDKRGSFGVRGSELHWPIQAPSLKKACGPSKMCYLCLHWRYPQEESQVLVSWGLGVSRVQRWVLLWSWEEPSGCQYSRLCVWDTSTDHQAVYGLHLRKYILLWNSSQKI